ncbi:hypothetical protein [Streptomyces sp. I05A-00742]|nr:hypothetical protein [Streptomyces sp. I05A-00742]
MISTGLCVMPITVGVIDGIDSIDSLDVITVGRRGGATAPPARAAPGGV